MELSHVLGNTWALEGSGMMGLYRLPGNRCILLDSGELFERQDLADALAQAGLTPVGALSSHVHIDHSVNNGWLRRSYGCRIALPAGEAFLTRSTLALKSYLCTFSPGQLAEGFCEMAAAPDELIPPEDGQFTFCGVPFQVLHTPGHSLDHLSVVTPDGVCYVGDAVFSEDGLSARLPYVLDLALALRSMKKLLPLGCPAYIVSHRGIHRQLAPLAAATQALLLDRAGQIAALIRHPMTVDEIWREVNVLFHLHPADPIAAAKMARNLLAYLDYLLDTGVLTQSVQDGMLLYGPA